MKFIIIELTYNSQNGVHDSYIGVNPFSMILELSKCGNFMKFNDKFCFDIWWNTFKKSDYPKIGFYFAFINFSG